MHLWPLLAQVRQKLRSAQAVRAVSGFKVKTSKPHGLPSELIVTLTSYPKRYDTLELTLKSLLMQSIKPDRLILWVADSDSKVPAEVERLTAHSLEIRMTKDIRSYKKVIPALEEFPHAYLVTADDDLYYERKWLERIVTGAVLDEPVIVCRRAHRPKRDAQGFAPYADWEHDIVTGGDMETCIFPTSGGGVLYPPGSLAPEVLDRSFMRLCPYADDVWLFVMAMRAGTRFRQVGGGFAQISWEKSQSSSLMHYNLRENGNDKQLAAVLEHYPIDALPRLD